MRVRLLPSAFDRREYQYLTSFVVNDEVAVDAGSLGFHGDPDQQARVGHVFLTHSHADHVCSLPMFVNNVFERRTESAVVHGHREVLASLRHDMFNGRVWPDFLRLTHNGSPLLRIDEIVASQACAIDGLTVVPVPVNHPVPTFAYLIDDGRSAIVISTDSGPTDEIWSLARRTPHLKAVFLGASYPEEEQQLARRAGHLTPSLVREEIGKMPAGVPVVAVHIKPTHRALVVDQLGALGLSNLSIGQSGQDYVF